jgi:hypothetical protein
MIAHSFDAHIVNGQLVPAEPLKAFEGQKVRVTVTAPEKVSAAPEPAEDFDVEKDVYVKMPLASEVIPNPVVAKGNGLKPCLILPEELPNE